jgi:hypothetical protein
VIPGQSGRLTVGRKELDLETGTQLSLVPGANWLIPDTIRRGSGPRFQLRDSSWSSQPAARNTQLEKSERRFRPLATEAEC